QRRFHWALVAASFVFVSWPASAQEPASGEDGAEQKDAARAAAEAAAKKDATDSLPGSPRPVGPSLSPEAPPRGPAPGGRAPSFGAPTDKDAWVFRLGGRISAWGRFGVGRTAEDSPPRDGVTLHTPPLIVGPDPIYSGTAATLNFQYGNQTLMAFASYE